MPVRDGGPARHRAAGRHRDGQHLAAHRAGQLRPERRVARVRRRHRRAQRRPRRGDQPDRGDGRRRDQGQPGQQPLGGDEPGGVLAAARAVPGVPRDALAPQRARHPVPVLRRGGQPGAARLRAQRPHHHPGRRELVLHPGDADRGVAGRHAQGGGDLGPVQLAGGLQPPQRQQFPVSRLQPPGGLRRLFPLAGQAEPQDGQLDEVGFRVGHLIGEIGGRRGLPGPVVVTHLPDRHRDQPGPERGRVAQVAQVAHDPQHGFLHHVVHVGVPAQGPADDVVDQRQVPGQQAVQRTGVPGLRGQHRLHARPGPGHPHRTSRSSAAAGYCPARGWRRREPGRDNRNLAAA